MFTLTAPKRTPKPCQPMFQLPQDLLTSKKSAGRASRKISFFEAGPTTVQTNYYWTEIDGASGRINVKIQDAGTTKFANVGRARLVEGHKYILRGAPKSNNTDFWEHVHSIRVRPQDITSSIAFLYASDADVGGVIFTVPSGGSGSCYLRFYVAYEEITTDYTSEALYFEVIDLTQWFSGDTTILNTITTPGEAYALGVPRDYIPYNAGEIISADCDAVVSKDSEQTTLGTLNIPAGLRTAHPLRSAPTVHDVYDLTAKKHIANVGSRAYQTGDEDDPTVITDGTTTLYPLTTPVVTNISEYLDGIDNYLPVEDGGSLTFHQTSSEFPVPNTEDFYYVLEGATT